MFHKDFWLKYDLYIQSEHWKNVRDQAFLKYGKFCLFCGSLFDLEVHHIIYHPEDLRLTEVSEVRPFCKYHHDAIHKLTKRGKLTFFDNDTVDLRVFKILNRLESFPKKKIIMKKQKSKILGMVGTAVIPQNIFTLPKKQKQAALKALQDKHKTGNPTSCNQERISR